jgi:putative DNA primase/helicase
MKNINAAQSLYGVALDEFSDDIADKLGVILSVIERDGKIHRFGPKDQYWYIAHFDDCPAGAFGDWKHGIKYTWKFSGHTKPYSEAEMQAYKQRLAEQERQRQKEIFRLQSQAAIRAHTIWIQSVPAPPDYPYLIKKGTDPHNLRLYQDALVSAIHDRDKQLVNLQFINPDGTKRFMKGGKLQNCFSVIGKTSDAPMALTEGWATGASVYEKHGHQTFIAFSANNLEPVARVLRDLFPMRRLYVYGDNDLSSVGQGAAQKAAIAVKGVAVIPDIPGTDWNDNYLINDTKEVSV